MSFTTFPFLRLTLVWISGIVVATYYAMECNRTLIGFGIFLGIYLILFIFLKIKAVHNQWYNGLGCLFLFVISYINTLLHITHPSNTVQIAENSIKAYQLSIERIHPIAPQGFKAEASIHYIRDHVGWHHKVISIQLYFAKKCDYIPVKGDILLIRGAPIPSPILSHPTHVKYASLYKEIPYYQKLKKKNSDFMLLPKYIQRPSWSTSIRSWLHHVITRSMQVQEAIALVHTLLFGEKEQLSPTLRQAYIHTGTMHLLVVSGLHVHMLYRIIHIVMHCVFNTMGMHLLSNIMVLIILWFYAWLCYFTPPVLRATIMLTIAHIGLMIGRKANTYNALFVSAFALLLWKPLLLYNCGFQLSYIATLGILHLQPPIKSIIHCSNSWLQKIGDATSLSLAAQISTLPLILYYFKSFPIYFIISNGLIVPAMFAILLASFMLVAFAYFPIISKSIGFLLSKLIVITNQAVSYMAYWPYSIVQISILNGYAVYLLYSIILSIYMFFRHKNIIYAVIVTVCIACFKIMQIHSIVAGQQQVTLLLHNDHNSCTFTLKDNIKSINYHDLQPIRSNIPCLQTSPEGVIATWHGKTIIFIKSIPADWYCWQCPKLEVDFICLLPGLLKNIDILLSIFTCKTWVIYSHKRSLKRHIAKQNGITWIWLPPNKQKTFVWSKKGI